MIYLLRSLEVHLDEGTNRRICLNTSQNDRRFSSSCNDLQGNNQHKMGPPRYKLVYKPLWLPVTIVISTIKPLIRQLSYLGGPILHEQSDLFLHQKPTRYRTSKSAKSAVQAARDSDSISVVFPRRGELPGGITYGPAVIIVTLI